MRGAQRARPPSERSSGASATAGVYDRLRAHGRWHARPMAPTRASWIPDELAHRRAREPRSRPRRALRREGGRRAPRRGRAGSSPPGCPSRRPVVDLGAGTGQFTLAVAEHAARGRRRRRVARDARPARDEGDAARARPTSSACAPASSPTSTRVHRPTSCTAGTRCTTSPTSGRRSPSRRAATMLAPGGLLRLWDVVYGFDPGDAAAALEAWFSSVPEGAIERGLDPGGARRARARRAQHLHVAARADDRARRTPHRGGRARSRPVLRPLPLPARLGRPHRRRARPTAGGESPSGSSTSRDSAASSIVARRSVS